MLIELKFKYCVLVGTFTAIDICLAQAAAEHAVDVRGVVAKIRQQRACSVQMAKQYAFIYRAIYTRLHHLKSSSS